MSRSCAPGSREVIEEQAAHPLPESLVHELGQGQALEREPELHRVEGRQSACAGRPGARSRDRRAWRSSAATSGACARVWISAKRARSAGRRTTCAQNSKNTASQPSSVAAPPRRRERQGVEPGSAAAGGGDLALILGDPALCAALVDGEEERPPSTRSSSTRRPWCSPPHPRSRRARWRESRCP